MFFDKKYPVNSKGAKAMFYPANSLSLGDNILWTIIYQDYLNNNPEEEVSFIPFNTDILNLVQNESIDKLFIRIPSCVTDDQVAELRTWTEVFTYELHIECHKLWKKGIYPKFESSEHSAWGVGYGAKRIEHWAWDISKQYVVFHIRNIKTIKAKNTNPDFVRAIMEHLIQDCYAKRYIVLLGNDASYGRNVEFIGFDSVVDLRKKLSLAEIFKIIKQSQLFIGSDSGIAHLAGCCNVPMVCWNFVDEYWFPKVRNIHNCLFLTKEESKLEVILREIRKKLG